VFNVAKALAGADEKTAADEKKNETSTPQNITNNNHNKIKKSLAI
jgi:hypothetical protein